MADRSDTNALVTRILFSIAPISAQFLLDPQHGQQPAEAVSRGRICESPSLMEGRTAHTRQPARQNAPRSHYCLLGNTRASSGAKGREAAPRPVPERLSTPWAIRRRGSSATGEINWWLHQASHRRGVTTFLGNPSWGDIRPPGYGPE